MHPDTDSEVQRLLRPLSTKWVQAVCGVSRETVAEWRGGKQQPRPDRWDKLVAAVAATLPDTERSAPPAEADGAMERFVERWESVEPPEWAQKLTDQILSGIELNRQALLEQTAAQYAALVELLLGPDNGDAAPPQSKGPQPKPRGPKQGPPGPTSPPTE